MSRLPIANLGRRPSAGRVVVVPVGTRLEELHLEPLTGGGSPVTAADLQGKVTLINFWGPWCPPCRQEFPHLMEIEQHFRDNDRFQFLSISCSGQSGSDEEMGPMTEEFLDEHGASFPTYRDPFQEFAKYLMKVAKLDGFVFPTSLVVDQNGVIRGMWKGYAPGDRPLPIFLGDESAAEHWRHPENLKESPRHALAGEPRGFGSVVQQWRPEAHGRRRFNRACLTRQIVKSRVAHVGGAATVFLAFLDQHQSIASRIRRRGKQRRACYGIDRRRRADAQGECRNNEQ
jgi:thiol-disulfide isomerase/thioredoxin